MLIPTVIRYVNMADNDELKMYPRSGLSAKYGFVPMNRIIDADYADSKNEGYIYIKMKNGDDKNGA